MKNSHYTFIAPLLGLALGVGLGCDSSTSPGGPLGPQKGALRVTSATTGPDAPVSGYNIEVRTPAGYVWANFHVPLNGTTSIDLVPATYYITIKGLFANCEPAIQMPLAVTVTAGIETQVPLSVACSAQSLLAFVNGVGSDAEIYLISSDGLLLQRITTRAGADVNPAWSPDGTRIAFASERDGNFEIYLMNGDGTNPVRLTNVAAADYSPAWSPDGKRIAFVSERDGNPQIYLMNVDGTGATRLTSNNAKDTDPAWSPDGSKIAFATTRDGFVQIYVMKPDGSGLSRITNTNLRNVNPAWSPDGSAIAFSSGVSFDRSQIWTMKPDGGSPTALTPALNGAADPTWSPDGRKIAYTAIFCDFFYYDYCDYAIHIVRADGTPFALTTGLNATEATWRP